MLTPQNGSFHLARARGEYSRFSDCDPQMFIKSPEGLSRQLD
jgi:hypothetical protein